MCQSGVLLIGAGPSKTLTLCTINTKTHDIPTSPSDGMGVLVPVGCGVWPENRPDEAALSEPSKEPYSCWNTEEKVHTNTTISL